MTFADLMRVTFVSGGLGCGGAERVVCTLSAALVRRGHSPAVVTLSNKEADFFPLPKGINRVALDLIADVRPPGMAGRLRATAGRLRALRRAILGTGPDVVVSSLQHVNVLTLLALAGTRCPVVVTEHNDPTQISCGRPWDELRRLTYGRAARLVSVSRGVDQHFAWLPPAQRTVIYNPLPIIEPPDEAADLPAILNDDADWVMAMGRLSRQKGFDLLLTAFAKVAAKNPGWRLMILGEGEQRPELERLIESLGLRDRVALPGRIKNPFPVLRRAKLFALPSRHEGFGNALIEAMGCGVAVVAADCPSGPGEIVRGGESGVLVPAGDAGALAGALGRLMADPAERARLAGNGGRARELFGAGRITGAWEELLRQVAAEHARSRRGTPAG